MYLENLVYTYVFLVIPYQKHILSISLSHVAVIVVFVVVVSDVTILKDLLKHIHVCYIHDVVFGLLKSFVKQTTLHLHFHFAMNRLYFCLEITCLGPSSSLSVHVSRTHLN